MSGEFPRAARLTPAGRGAVATVAVAGDQATAIVDRYFRSAANRRLEQFPIGRVVFGRWCDSQGGQTEEEVVVTRRGPQWIEIHCHGGHAAPARLLSELETAGCRIVPWTEWLQDQAEPLTAAAAQALAEARTQRVAAVLLDQYRGALADRLRELVDLIENHRHCAAVEGLDLLLARWSLGQHLRCGWRVVLAGQPNSGKSSLFNAVLGYRRVIVYQQPGTTRDAVAAGTAIDGWPVELIDTAGIRESSCALESAGILRARQSAREADLVVLVSDLGRPWSDEDQRLWNEHPQAMLLHNKQDLAGSTPGDRPPGFLVSALSGYGINDWLNALARRLVPDPPAAGEPVPFAPWQAELLAEARRLANRDCWTECRGCLQRTLGGHESDRSQGR